MLQQYTTQSGIQVEFTQTALNYHEGITFLIEQLDSHRGALFTSSFEYPGRYTCWDIGFYNPPIALSCRQRKISVEALNRRGETLLLFIYPELMKQKDLEVSSSTKVLLEIIIKTNDEPFSEEERSRQASVFTVLRVLLHLFKADEDSYLGLYGSFGFDLIHQFEDLQKHKTRDESQRDMVLYFADELYIVDHRKEVAFVRQYDFNFMDKTTRTLPRKGSYSPYSPVNHPQQDCDHKPFEYVQTVNKAKERFACGDLFEVVPSQTFYSSYSEKPSTLFKQMKELNPSPYGFLINLGEAEYLIGASPEMYVRVQDKRVETCPISGTIRRGEDAIEDAFNIQLLLDSKKEESELTMCTDVDRNDKSRICEAGSVKVIGRRQIEMYSKLIHTVDHVEGVLRDGFDAVDAFLTHMWVVTVTGAPKLWALNFIEEHEKSPRRWYGGAVGWFGFNGHLNTGLVLRTVRLEKGVAELRVGATLLYDSVPELEELETRLKASAFLELIQSGSKKNIAKKEVLPRTGLGKKVLLVDHQDSFVHTLANYIRQTGAQVTTVRYDKVQDYLSKGHYHLIVLSPGPGRPCDFKVAQTIERALETKTPLFGVCLGLQGIVEFFGGDLDLLSYPMHGKSSTIKVLDGSTLFAGLGREFKAGRYHSLYARATTLPKELEVTAISDDGVIMAVAHKTLPIQAVQFHPETILSLLNQAGLKIIINLMDRVN